LVEVNDTSDHGLLKSASTGDERAFTELFRRYQQPVYRYAFRLTGSAESAEDLTQECFIRVLRSAARFDAERGSLRSYLYATVRNLAISLARPALDGLDDEADSLGVPDLAMGAEERLLGHEAASIVQSAIAMLPAAQREALILIHYQELSLQEAADVLSIDVGAVKSRVHRARENLKQWLAPHFGGPAGGEARVRHGKTTG
jgi:RNA polymerase sigma-70 factor (ECF subfamily)